MRFLLVLLLAAGCATPGRAPFPLGSGLAKGFGTYPACSNNLTDKMIYDPVNLFHCGDDQKGGTLTLTDVSQTRTVNTTFTPDATRPVEGCYTLSFSCAATLLGGQATTVTLLSDAASPPTTPLGASGASNSVSLAIAITLTNGQTGQICGWVRPNHNARLSAVNTGTGCTTSVVTSRETAFAVL